MNTYKAHNTLYKYPILSYTIISCETTKLRNNEKRGGGAENVFTTKLRNNERVMWLTPDTFVEK